MTDLEAILSVFGIIGIACWPVALRDFHRLYREAAARGTAERTQRAFVGLATSSLLLSLVILGSGLVHGHHAAIAVGAAYAIVNASVAVTMSRYRIA